MTPEHLHIESKAGSAVSVYANETLGPEPPTEIISIGVNTFAGTFSQPTKAN